MSQWPPIIPPRLKKSLAEFTFYRDGVTRWYKGASRHVCGKRVPLDQIADLWDEHRRIIDAEAKGVRVDGYTVADGMAKFYEWLDHRLATGNPKPLAAATRVDYEKSITGFARLRVPDGGRRIAEMGLNELGPEQFTAFAKKIAHHAPSTLARHFAYLNRFFAFCDNQNLMDRVPQYGDYFARPVIQAHRDVRLRQRKSLSPQEIRLLYFHGTVEEKVWLLLGIFGAFDNSDIANLTRDTLDREKSLIDFRRRKTGLMPRLVPVPEWFWEILDLHQRPDPINPAHADLVFLTPEGHPLGRAMRSSKGNPHRVDYVSMCWTRLMRRAGLRPVSVITHACAKCGKDKAGNVMQCVCGGTVWKRREKSGGGGDRRGFRSLRTTFGNLAPPKSRDEIELVMGHAGGILLENYLEEYGVDGIREVVDHVWHRAFNHETPLGPKPGNPKP